MKIIKLFNLSTLFLLFMGCIYNAAHKNGIQGTVERATTKPNKVAGTNSFSAYISNGS